MNIYKVSQDINGDYDTYDSFVCVAESEDDARDMHPNGELIGKSSHWDWVSEKDKHLCRVDFIGVASPESTRGVILASFNAG